MSIFLELVEVERKSNNGFHLGPISWNMESGERVAVVGATGSGKSSFLKLIGGLMEPTGGKLWFRGERIWGPAFTLVPGHAGIVYLSQQFDLPQNIRIEQALEYANQLSEEDALNLYAVCDILHLRKRKTHEVSGGEKQRVALARILSMKPALLLLDEPFSNADPHHKRILKQILDHATEKQQLSVIMINHEATDTLPWASNILILENGQLSAEGSPTHLYQQPPSLYAAGLLGKWNWTDFNWISQHANGNWWTSLPCFSFADAPNQEGFFSRPEDWEWLNPAEQYEEGKNQAIPTLTFPCQKLFFEGPVAYVTAADHFQVMIPGSSMDSLRPGMPVTVRLKKQVNSRLSH